MKKTVCLLLSLLLCLPLFAVPAVATEGGSTSTDPVLVSHYDFEGKDLAEQLSDKAGTYKNNLWLTQPNTIPQITVIDNGVFTKIPKTGTFTPTKGNHKLNGNVGGGTDTDMSTAIENDFTWIVRVRVNKELTDYEINPSTNQASTIAILDARYWGDKSVTPELPANRAFFLGYQASTDQFITSVAKTDGSQSTVLYSQRMGWVDDENTTENEVKNTNKWLTLAITCENTAEEGEEANWVGTMFYRMGDATTWSKNEKLFCTGTRPALTDNNKLTILGECVGDAISVDDIKLYRGAMNQEQLNRACATEVSLVGAQRSVVNTNADPDTCSVRFVAKISADCIGAGFLITPVGYQTQDISVEHAYTSILATTTDGEIETIEAPEGYYYIAVIVEGVPIDTAITFEVEPYVFTSDNVKMFGDAGTVTVSPDVAQGE